MGADSGQQSQSGEPIPISDEVHGSVVSSDTTRRGFRQCFDYSDGAAETYTPDSAVYSQFYRPSDTARDVLASPSAQHP